MSFCPFLGVYSVYISPKYGIYKIPCRNQRWIKNYREQGLAGLADTVRADNGTSRKLPPAAIHLIEGLALQTSPRSAASIHRQVEAIAREQGWKSPSYGRVRQIIKNLDPALVTMAHEGTAAYREEFDLLSLIERFFRSVDQLLLQDTSGYAP